jgi:exo-beta-1,3-glucanase (GH17 family)
MKHAFGAFLVAAIVVVTGWWWLGQPKPMPVAPLGSGDKLDCVSYAPFRDAETPIELATHIAPSRIEEDLRRLAAVTNCVRTYSVHQGLDRVAPIAQRIGIKVMQGLWLGREPAFNKVQVDGAIAIAKRYPDTVRAVVVGNEVLLRGELSGAALADIVRTVKSQVPVPVTYADVWEFWLRNRDLVGAVDFVTIHILPYWEDFPIGADKAADHVISIRKQVAESFPGKEIMIGEFGWPSAGRMREGALPSPANQARVIQEVIARARQEKFGLNVIEAFDQPWKRRFEGTVGGRWGLLDGSTRAPKFEWGKPVSDHPDWLRNIALGMVLAGGIVGAAFLLRRQDVGAETSSAVWPGVAVTAAVSGVVFGLVVEQAMVESFGWAGVVRSIALLAIAAVGPLVAAAALARGVRIPSFEQVLGRATERSMDRVALALGLVVIALTVIAIQAALGLVFDPRYRDFPYAALSAPIVPLALLALLATGRRSRRRLAETVAAATLAISAIYIVFNESFVNWQAIWFCVALVALAAILLRSRDAPG